MIGKTNSIGGKGNILSITIRTNQADQDDVLGATVSVNGKTYTWNGSALEIEATKGAYYTISFSEVANYKKPNDMVIAYTDGVYKIEAEYKCELLTVNVSADEGVPTGFEITISKKEVLGAYGEYTRLEYIESTGTQYIDTGFKPNQDTKVEIIVGITSVSDAGNGVGFIPYGAGFSYNSNAFECYSVGGQFEFNYANQYDFVGNLTSGHKVNISHDKGSILVVDETNGQTWEKTFTYGTFSAPYNMTICAINRGNEICGQQKVYSCKIYDNEVLIRDYIPALRSDGIAGLYDAVTDTFYVSNGSGGFVAGNKIEKIIATQTSTTDSYKIPFGETYSVDANNVNGFKKPISITRAASERTFTANMQYAMVREIDLSLQDVYGNPINRSTANCYVIKEVGQYKFPMVFGNAINNGATNSDAYTKNSGSYSHDFVDYNGTKILSPYIETVSGQASTAQLSIADTDGVFTNISIVNGDGYRYVRFEVASVPDTGANGVISIKNSSGVIMWSWHIWVWADDLTPVEITNSTSVKYKILPVNLASKWDSGSKTNIKNWFYQFGRPTPLLCPAAYNSTSNHASYGALSYAEASIASNIQKGIQNPATFYKYSLSYYYNWFQTNSDKTYNLWDAACTSIGNSDNNVVKTVYDPCPIGFKMPNGNTFTYFSTSNVVGNFANGWKFKRYSGDTTGVFFPASGYRNYYEGLLYNVGSGGCVWLSSADSQYYAYSLNFDSSSVVPRNYKYRALGFSVRPVQE